VKNRSEKIIPADFRMVRMINRSIVLRTLYESRHLSRVDISRLTGLKKSTISIITKELIEEGLVVEERLGQSAVGRKPIILKLNERSRIIGTIEVANADTTLTVCDLVGNVLDRCLVKTVAGDAGTFFSACGRTLAGMVAKFSETLAGVGVGSPGVISSARGYLHLYRTLKWKDVDIRGLLEKELRCRVFVENDAKVGALAELWFGRGTRDLSNFVFIWVCAGIGVGIIMNRSLYHGFSSLGGHFGHQLIKIDGKWEDVSSEYTWEDFASEDGVLRRFNEIVGHTGEDRELDIHRVVELARQGDHNAVRALKENARYLGVGLANINNGLGPERIIVGGRMVQVWDLIFEEMVRQVELHTLYQVNPIRNLIVPSTLEAPIFDGARALVMQEVFGAHQIR
jgi:predicted NBD/HSP70 family sugar kinase